ncbi:MAG TPA: STAS domain-containing protein [Pseudonocardia sp.]|jgi:anti-sigma B factor antagonist|uniref:STAS domain-containing protein n=1 Tax=Pseudonocardia sp. TaxID=60912 RepID=UPI002CCFFBA7|nr:STAS domain-containing protein [Pseudonocardia sp.]HTF47104.1 STAS domain-containing protein [Pseudonocardia sp.]
MDPSLPEQDQIWLSATQPAEELSVVHVGGELDMLTAPMLTDFLARALASRPRNLIIDITEVTFLGSSGLRALLDGQHLAGEATRVALAVTPRSAALRSLEVSRLLELFKHFPTAGEAMAALADHSVKREHPV